MQSAEKNLYPIVILQDFVNKAVLKTQLEKGSARAPDRNTPVDYRTLGKVIFEGVLDHYSYKTDVTTKVWGLQRLSARFWPRSPHFGRQSNQLMSVALINICL